MLTADFLKIIGSYFQFPGVKMPVLPPLQTLTKANHRISLKNKTSLKKFQVIWQPYRQQSAFFETNVPCKLLLIKFYTYSNSLQIL